MTANSSPLSPCGTPAAGSSSSSTFGLGGERQRDLEEPLLAVGEFAGRPVADRAEPQREQDRVSLLDRVGIGRQLPPPGPGVAAPLADRERHRLERAEMREQGVDLEGAHEAALDPLLRPERRDVVRSPSRIGPASGLQHAGHQVDERGLAGAVRPDQRVAHAVRQIELDVAWRPRASRSSCRGRASRAPPRSRRRSAGAASAGPARRGCRSAGTSRPRPAAPRSRNTSTAD